MRALKAPATTTVVLVHGGWVDASSWREVIPMVSRLGAGVVAPQLGLRDFAEDVAIVSRCLDRAPGSVLLVGHSYGGAVVTELAGRPNVKGVVYAAAAAPTDNEPFGVTMSRFQGAYAPDLAPDAAGLLWGPRELFAEGLAHDLAPGCVDVLFATQRPVCAAIFGASSRQSGPLDKPAWYLVSHEDRLLPARAQETLAKAIGAEVHGVSAGHLSPLSAPSRLADIISLALLSVAEDKRFNAPRR